MDIQFSYSTEARQTAAFILRNPPKKEFDHQPIDSLLAMGERMGLDTPNVKGSKAELLQLLRDRAGIINLKSTQESREQFELNRRASWIDENREEVQRLRDAIAKFAGEIQANPWNMLNGCDHIFEKQAELWWRLAIERVALKDGEGSEDVSTAGDRAKTWLVMEARGLSRRGANRSTSQTSNLAEDCKRVAAYEVIDWMTRQYLRSEEVAA